LFHFLAIPIVSRYELTDARYDELRADLDRRVDAETQEASQLRKC